MKCSLDYSRDLFEESTVAKMAEQFQVLLKQLFFASPTVFDLARQPIYELSILLPEELKLIQNMNNTYIDFTTSEEQMKCIHQQFTETANKNPQKLAVILDEQSLTYAELLVYVQHLSLSLMNDHHVVPGSIICQCVERSIEMVIGILSILTCGAVYCPLSPNDPEQRLQSLIQETHSRLVIIHTLTRDKFVTSNVAQFLHVDFIIGSMSQTTLDENDLDVLSNVQVTVEDVSYVIFTSGSTGRPKAVNVNCFFFT
ncbi:unnamed protein product [Didymodactylos carnosus]|uniref:AMP-dependent synthetase/ligase domain-containing protein n=1 Tax=Didymodactylos carnosus TaxID=1234261 RepID=A0A815T3M2_9BILA|nr:unnamed protein product [Didymodactylos carnosus]CAF4362832.1 unnamed protein product [Didymodactylos carnosus]